MKAANILWISDQLNESSELIAAEEETEWRGGGVIPSTLSNVSVEAHKHYAIILVITMKRNDHDLI